MRHWIAAALMLTALPLSAGTPSVMTDIPVTQSLVAAVMDGLGNPEVLVQPGVEPHDVQLRPSQAAALDGAGLLFWIGPEMTPWLARLATDPARSVVLIDAPGVTSRPPMFGPATSRDPHVWLDPANARAMAAAIAAALSTADPDNAAAYRANAARLDAAIAALDAELAQALATATATRLLVEHDAFAHLAARYGLDVAAALRSGDAAEPGAASVARLRDLALSGGIDCAFAEPSESPALMQRLTEGTSATLGTLDPEGTALPPGPGLYARLMRETARAIAGCKVP